MPYAVVIPRLGLTMESARVVQWYKRAGETVARGEPLFSVESDKAVQDIEALSSGVVYPLTNLPDEALPIATVIGYILAPGEALPIDATAVVPAGATGAVPANAPAPSSEQAPASPPAQPVATPTAAALTQPAAATPQRVLSSPAARRRARELGLDWRTIERPGGGPILRAHVERAAASVAAAPTSTLAPGLIESLTAAVDAEALSILLERLGAAVTPAALYARIAASAVARTPAAAVLDAAGLPLVHAADYAADDITPALDPGQVAVLSIGRSVPRPTRLPDGKTALRQTVAICLTFDRAVLARESAGQLLAALRALIEQPFLLLA
ncbi:MAG: hypothetical protein GX557_15740 [Chloroflexi bacterium]|nr:hypothetical protein [Chloroflexota bacterium]